MKIFITGFKCYTQAEFIFKSGQITLLSGPSGQGKSSIFTAITWCLYGAERNVEPFGEKKDKLHVVIEDEGLTIKRQKRPNLLTVITDKSEYTKDAAQDIINKRYGVREMWNSVGYIVQDCKNSLLEASNAEKIDILNRLAFADNNPESHIETIINAIKQRSEVLEQAKSKYDNRYFDYKTHLTDNNITMIPSQLIDLDKLKARISQLQNELDQAYRLEAQYKVNQQRQTELLTRIAKTEAIQVDQSYLTIDESKLEQESTRLKQMCLEYNANLSKQEQVRRLKAQLPSITKPLDYSDDDLRRAQIDEYKYNSNKAKAQELNVAYDSKAIEVKLAHLNTVLKNQEQLRLHNEYDKLELEIKTKIAKEYTAFEVQNAKDHLIALETFSNIVSCPHCDSSLRIDRGKLVKADGHPVQSSDIIKARKHLELITQGYQDYNSYLALLDRRDHLKTQLKDRPEGRLLTKQELGQAQEYINKLSSIEVYNKPDLDPAVVKEHIKYNTLMKQISTIEYVDSMIDPRNEMCSLGERLTEYHRARAKDLDKRKELQALRAELDRIDLKPVTESSSELRIKLREVEAELKRSTELNCSYNKNVYLQELKAVYDKAAKRLTLANKLKELAISTVNQTLQTTVNNLNNIINDVAASLFNDPITIKIKLDKQLKTSERIKPGFNIAILYKNNEYDSIKMLSGGEASRVSLAITLALNNVSGCNILLLDEVMANLDAEIKELCIEAIRKYSLGKTVVCINHEGIEGIYDDVISLS